MYYEGKSTLKYFGFSQLSSGLSDGETSVNRTTIAVLIKYNVLMKVY